MIQQAQRPAATKRHGAPLIGMRHRKPKTLWGEVRAAFGFPERDDDEGEKARDPALLFHLLFTVPLLISLMAAARRMAAA